MKIGISGASGQLGQATLSALRARNPDARVVAISRTPPPVSEGVEPRRGDYDDPAGLPAAYADLDALLLIPSSDMRQGVREIQLESAIDAAVDAGVPRIVLISSAAVEDAEPTGMFAAYVRAERRLKQRTENGVVLRMNYFAESFAQTAAMVRGTGVMPFLGGGSVAFVSRDDLADAAAAVLLGAGAPGAVFSIAGPEALDPTQRAKALEDGADAPVVAQPMDAQGLEAHLAGAGVPSVYAAPMIEIEKAFAAGVFGGVSPDLRNLTGRDGKPLREILATAVG